MFTKILIANRGEIACRVIKTARRLGIQSVAVYSDADMQARHVRLADEAVHIGPAAAAESYLVIEKIIAAAQQTGAQAIHPGYGFLSENEVFCHACDVAGLVFIGPPVLAIRAMGSKSEAKKLMEAAAVPLTPGYHGDDQSPKVLQQAADQIGYPVLIKAAAGGGGKGMRLVERAGDFQTMLHSCQREATASFGNAHVLVEKYVTRPRHIEIQIFGDTQGNYVYLFERDCSVQRRHQKVLEEAPAPGMRAERRAEMGRAAIEAARAVGYVGAGTVEFIASQQGDFYFMEMNTRLQVEHPVTEMITGLDLVEWQLRVAAGEILPLAQSELQLRGHAIEARIYAEDPDKGFLPATGQISHLSQPPDSLHVRVDSGVEEGDEISPHYDPMIAKLIVWEDAGERSRERALLRLQQALAQYRIVGVDNNIAFLSRLAASPAFSEAELDTGLIERETAFLFPQNTMVPDAVWQIAALAELLSEAEAAADAVCNSLDPSSPWHVHDSWRMNSSVQRELCFRLDQIQHHIQVTYASQGYQLQLDNGAPVFARGRWGTRGQMRVEIDGVRLNAAVIFAEARRHIFLNGHVWVLSRLDPLHYSGDGDQVESGLQAPMPGKVIALLVKAGDVVDKGAPLLVLEAMKMEHTIYAPAAGAVNTFYFNAGDQVSDGDQLLDFSADEAEAQSN